MSQKRLHLGLNYLLATQLDLKKYNKEVYENLCNSETFENFFYSLNLRKEFNNINKENEKLVVNSMNKLINFINICLFVNFIRNNKSQIIFDLEKYQKQYVKSKNFKSFIKILRNSIDEIKNSIYIKSKIIEKHKLWYKKYNLNASSEIEKLFKNLFLEDITNMKSIVFDHKLSILIMYIGHIIAVNMLRLDLKYLSNIIYISSKKVK